MLNRIKLKNFQRHRELEVVFNGGLTALRGANEAGKSTLLRAICYAAFGIKGVSATLAELVTWGEDEKSMRVELELGVEGVVYTVKRGKSGAELTYDGGIVTGQNEVTAFVCRLLKCDAVAASRLILANQNEIRGALEAGPAKTTELIEKLAEFDQIDQLVELIEEKLTIGSTAGVEAAIAKAQEQLDAARALAVEPDHKTLDLAIWRATGKKTLAEEAAVEAQAAVEAAQEAYNDGKIVAAERATLERQIGALDNRQAVIAGECEQLREVRAPDNVDVNALRTRIATAENHAAIREKYLKVTHYREYQTVSELEGTVEELDDRIARLRSRISDDEKEIVRCEGEAKTRRALVQTGGCSLCGKDVSNVPEVRAKNDQLAVDVDMFEMNARNLRASLGDVKVDLQRLESIRKACVAPLKVLDVVGDLAERVDDFLPPRLRWLGPDVTGEPENVSELQRQISDYERQQRAYEKAQTKLEMLVGESLALHDEFNALMNALNDVPEIDTAALQAAVERVRDELRPVQQRADEARRDLQNAERAKADALNVYERAKDAVRAATATVTERRSELEEMTFNNALLKRVRACRPLIADKLWNLVLSAVSAYFSEMRGSRSRVTKGADGFLVDRHPVTSLSGSTLDILGLAIRVALVRTFLPSAPFLILDEPAAAADADRTTNMLAFLAGSGFKQIIVCSHDGQSESICDNAVYLSS